MSTITITGAVPVRTRAERPLPRRSATAVLVTCLVATLSYSGAVTVPALLTYVVPGVLGAGLVATALVCSGRPLQGLVTAAALGLAVAELANVVGGMMSGPIARSTFIASLGTSLALFLADRFGRSAFLLPVAGIVIGALALGAAGEVGPVAAATALAGVFASAGVERRDRRWLARPPRRWLAPLMALACAASALGLALLQDAVEDEPPILIAAGQIDERIQPPQLLDDSPPSPMPSAQFPPPSVQPSVSPPPSASSAPSADPTPPPSVVPTTTPQAQVRTPPVHKSNGNRIWLLLLAAIAVLAVLLVVRVVVVKFQWLLLRRRLRRGDELLRVAGAWAWARYRLLAAGLPAPLHDGPDVVARPDYDLPLPGSLLAATRDLARHTVSALFGSPDLPTEREQEHVWALADEVAQQAKHERSRRARRRALFRSPMALTDRRPRPPARRATARDGRIA